MAKQSRRPAKIALFNKLKTQLVRKVNHLKLIGYGSHEHSLLHPAMAESLSLLDLHGKCQVFSIINSKKMFLSKFQEYIRFSFPLLHGWFKIFFWLV